MKALLRTLDSQLDRFRDDLLAANRKERNMGKIKRCIRDLRFRIGYRIGGFTSARR